MISHHGNMEQNPLIGSVLAVLYTRLPGRADLDPGLDAKRPVM